MKMESPADTRAIKGLIWLYFWLLIFEGAFRKWIVPSLSTPFLVVRDPVVVAIYVTALARGIFPRHAFVRWIVALAALDVAAACFGIGNWKVTVFGVHANFLHLPLIFIVPAVFSRADVLKMGGAFLILLFPMTALALEQFRAGPDAWINVGAGGDVGGQLFASADKVRPSGLFSFVTGMAAFLATTTAFALERFLGDRVARWSLPFFAVPTLVFALAVSASRSAVAGTAIVLGAGLIACLRQRRMFRQALLPVATAGVAYFGLSSIHVFHEGLRVHSERFRGAGGLREGILERLAGDLFASITAAHEAPWLGYGIGVGTNAGAGLLSGARRFLLAEGEWPRLVLESGVILGFAFIILRLALCIFVARASWRALGRGNALPLLLLGACAFDLTTGQLGQPAILGFVALVAGLALAAAKEDETDFPPAKNSASAPTGKVRGRAPLAEALHPGA